MKAVFALLPFFILSAGPAFSQEIYCDAAILEWQNFCQDTVGGDFCALDDVCILADKVIADENLRNAAIEVPADTPDGYQEQIFILQ